MDVAKKNVSILKKMSMPFDVVLVALNCQGIKPFQCNNLTSLPVFDIVYHPSFYLSSNKRSYLMATTKGDIVETLQSQMNLPKFQAADIIESLIEILKKTLASGEDVLIFGFGKFCVNEKNERRGRNPATGEDLMLRPKKVVTFKCSGKLRGKLNGRN